MGNIPDYCNASRPPASFSLVCPMPLELRTGCTNNTRSTRDLASGTRPGPGLGYRPIPQCPGARRCEGWRRGRSAPQIPADRGRRRALVSMPSLGSGQRHAARLWLFVVAYERSRLHTPVGHRRIYFQGAAPSGHTGQSGAWTRPSMVSHWTLIGPLKSGPGRPTTSWRLRVMGPAGWSCPDASTPPHRPRYHQCPLPSACHPDP